jgi:O-antigen/teichoic acid export membrane protein
LNNVRVTYSGLLNLLVGLSTIATGFAFSLILTRSLTIEEYGTWSLIHVIIGYLLASQAIVTFWTLRDISRGSEIGNTSILSSFIFSVGLIPVYISFVFLLSENSNVIQPSMILALILVPLFLLSRNLSAINSGFQPHVISYTLLVLESTRILTVIIFVYFLNLGLDGAIIALFIAQIIRVLFQTYLARSKLRSKLQVDFIKKWVKMSWLTVYALVPELLRNIDLVIYTIITSSVIGIAFYSVSLTLGKIVSHSEKISEGLYPKLLAGGEHSHIRNTFSLLLLFGLPLVGISIIFSKPGLYALNPIYQDATLIVILLSLKTFFLLQSNIIQKTLFGIENIDVSEKSSPKIFLKSSLFKLPSYRYIKLGIYLIVITTVFLLTKDNISEIELVTLWALIALVVEIPYLIFMWVLLSRKTSIRFPYGDAIKYLGATIVFMLVFLQTSEFIIIYHESIFDFLPSVFLQLIICVLIYFVIVYVIDKKTRKLFSLVINQIFKK